MSDGYNNDDTLRETIRNFLEDKLNASALVEGTQLVDFVVGKDLIKVNDTIYKVKQVDGTFRTIDKTFTLGMIMDFMGTPEPIKGYELISYTIPINFLASSKYKYNDIKESLERFTRLLIGQEYIESNYYFGTNCDEITNSEKVQTLNGIEYIIYTTTVYITSSKNAIINNFIKTYLGSSDDDEFDDSDLLRVYPIERTATRAFIPEETHKLNQKESKTVFRESTWIANLSLIIDMTTPLYRELIVELEEPTELNKTYSYRVEYPFTVPFITDKLIGLEGIVLDGEIGTYAVVSLVIKLSGI